VAFFQQQLPYRDRSHWHHLRRATVVINSLATTGSWYSDIESDPTTVLATSAITITPTGGTATTFATGLDSSGNKTRATL